MAKITLKLLDLDQGNRITREFEDEASALNFLRARPRMIDVLGVVVSGVTPEQSLRFKAAMRPLDDEERAAESKLADAAAKAEALVAEQRAKQAAIESAKNRAAILANPTCSMEVTYRFDRGISVAGDDPRELTEEARAAVAEWVAERNEWVKGRGQVVGEAKLTVWPGALPKEGAERVQTGSFIPVTAGDHTQN